MKDLWHFSPGFEARRRNIGAFDRVFINLLNWMEAESMNYSDNFDIGL